MQDTSFEVDIDESGLITVDKTSHAPSATENTATEPMAITISNLKEENRKVNCHAMYNYRLKPAVLCFMAAVNMAFCHTCILYDLPADLAL